MSNIAHLPQVGDHRRVIPNDLIRSSLFTVSNHNTPRTYVKDKLLYCYGNTEISYRGEELRQDDEDVLLQLIHTVKKQEDFAVDFMPYSFLGGLDWPQRTQYKDKLKESLSRLVATEIRLTNETLKSGFSFSLVRKFAWFDDAGQALKQWKVWLEPELVHLFQDNNFTKVEWQQRRRLKPLAKWLHSFYSSHREPDPIYMTVLRKATGSKMKTMKHFKVCLRASLLELAQVGFLRDFHIDAENRVHVSRIVNKPIMVNKQ